MKANFPVSPLETVPQPAGVDSEQYTQIRRINELREAVRARIKAGFGGRAVQLSPAPGARPHVKGAVSVWARTMDGEFQWVAGGSSETLAWARLLLAIPREPHTLCRACEVV